MATKKGKLDFKMVLIIVLTIGLAITIYTITTQNLANRSSAAPPIPGIRRPLPTKTMDDDTKECKKKCNEEQKNCESACKNEQNSCKNTLCGGDQECIDQEGCNTEFGLCKNSCKNELNACKKDCK